MATKSPKMKISPAARKRAKREMETLASIAAEQALHRRQQVQRDMARATMPVDEKARRNAEAVRGVSRILRLIASTYPEWDRRTAVKVALTPSSKVSGWTDFRSVNVNYPASRMVCDSLGSFDNEETREALRELMGVGYHEVGHCLYSLPFTHLSLDGEYHRAWNILEDQRMEMSVVRSSPTIAAYFTLMVVAHILDGNEGEAWWLVAGRLYLPERLRSEARGAFAKAHGKDAADAVLRVVRRYAAARTSVEMREAVVEAHLLLKSTKTNPETGTGEHKFSAAAPQADDGLVEQTAGDAEDERWDVEEPAPAEGEQAEPEERTEPGGGAAQDEGEPGDEPEAQAGTGDIEQPEDDRQATEDGQAGTGGERPQDDGHDDGQRGGSSAGGGDSAPKSDALTVAAEQAAEAAEEQVNAGTTMRDALRTLSEGHGEDGNSLPTLDEKTPLPADMVERAEAMAQDFVKALEVAAAYNQPSWQRRQDRGGVDAVAYRTRRPGDLNFRRQIVGDRHEGMDVAVSLVLDVSGSMHDHVAALSLTAYAVKSACWEVGVPCSISLYCSTTSLVSGADDEPEPVAFSAYGGTRIGAALAAVPEQRAGKQQHLVIVLSDGHIGDGRDAFGLLRASYDAHVMGIGLGYAGASALADQGCDDVFGITEPEQIAGFVEDYLASTLATR